MITIILLRNLLPQLQPKVVASIIRLGSRGILYYNYSKEPPKPFLIVKTPTLPLRVQVPNNHTLS